jgi:putative transposase
MLYQNKYRIESARLKNWDYRSSAPYFVTIDTKYINPYFGEIISGEMHLNELGAFANEMMESISVYSNCAKVSNHIIMPDHVHVIIDLKNDTKEHFSNRFGPILDKSLSSIINHYKGRVTRFANEKGYTFLWQDSFYDHMIRNSRAYRNIFSYISNNPANYRS